MTVQEQFLEFIAQQAAKQMVERYMPHARAFGLNKQQIIWVIRRTAEIAAETIDKQPS